MNLRTTSFWLLPSLALGFAIPACGGGGTDAATDSAGGTGTTAGGTSSKAGSSGASGHAGTAAGGSAGHTTGGSAGSSGAAAGSAGHATGGASGNGGSSNGGSSGSAGHTTGGSAGSGGSSAGGASAGGSGGATGGSSTGGAAGSTSTGGTSTGGAAGAAGSGGMPLMCMTGTADCNHDPSDGCEVDTDTDPMNCSQCGMKCDAGAMCVMGACQCAGTSQKASLIPLDMYIMLDHSGSMKDNNKWTSVSAALDMFFVDPTAADLGVGLAFFPSGKGADNTCSETVYATPVVDIAPLGSTGQATALTTAVANEQPNGGNTPTGSALQGSIDKVKAWKKANPTHTVVVVLATDGQPNGCGSLNMVEQIAASGVSGTPSVLTYVIGVGSSTGNLDGIAMNGGTTSAFPVDNGDSAAFLAALKKIQGTSIGCQYQLPTPMMGQTLDFTKVNVEYTAGGMGTPTVLPNVGDMSGCAANPTGWYYDNAANPTQILLCSSECTTVKADMNASVEVVLGCSTQKPLARKLECRVSPLDRRASAALSFRSRNLGSARIRRLDVAAPCLHESRR